MICIEFLATKRATGLGEAHISLHRIEKQHLTRSHSYACCNPCTSLAAPQESGWARRDETLLCSNLVRNRGEARRYAFGIPATLLGNSDDLIE
jgi:hypothetical protein